MKTIRVRIALLIVALNVYADGQLYKSTDALYKKLLDPSVYNSHVAPVLNLSQPLVVQVDFRLFTIVAVDDTRQSLATNAFLTLKWLDERLRWDPDDFEGQFIIHPLPDQIWRPRVILLNTVGERDIFTGDISPVYVFPNGSVFWVPGSLFTTSCSLDLLKYPFDEQHCDIKMISMGLVSHELRFMAGHIDRRLYTANGEWDLKDVEINGYDTVYDTEPISSFVVRFHFERRPMFYLLCVILPFVLLSFLNMLIFIIPRDSGEKVGYGMTVVLALSVFFSIISDLLPRSSTTLPYIIIYLFILYVLSVVSVIDSLVIILLHRLEEQTPVLQPNSYTNIKMNDVEHRCSSEKPKPRSDLVPYQRSSIKATGHILHDHHSTNDQQGHGPNKEKTGISSNGAEGKRVSKTLDFVSCLVFVFTWVAITLWFFISVLN